MFFNVTLFALLAINAALVYGCFDERDDCAQLKKNYRGGCYGHVLVYMKKTCPKTCGFCRPMSLGNPYARCGMTATAQSRIISGNTAKQGAWPWMVSLTQNGNHYCGASLISPNWVLTAAHCVDKITSQNIWQYQIRLGAFNHNNKEGTQQNIAIKQVRTNNYYSLRPIWADLALIKLDRPAKLNKYVNTICLAKLGENIPTGATCYLTGWGSIQHPGAPYHTLQQAKLPVVNNAKCIHSSESICAGYGYANSKNACRGDSGGPFVCRNRDGSWKQYGVASYVVTYCKYYTGFAPISKYRSWIDNYAV